MAKAGAASCVAFVTGVALSACGSEPEPLITEEALRQGTYLTQFAEGGRVTLSDGEFHATLIEGRESDLAISLGPLAVGDLNTDGRDDAAVVLIERMGRMRSLYNLHAVVDHDSVMRDVAWVLLGDRIRVDGVRVDTGLVHVDMRVRGPREPAVAEPTVPYRAVYALTDRGLRLVESSLAGAAPGADSLPARADEADEADTAATAVTGAEWKLVSIELEDEVVTPVFSSRGDPSFLFTREFGVPDFGSGRLTGRAGCNRIFGNYRVGPADSLSISSIALTYMSCPEPLMEIERLLVRALELTRTYRRTGDELVLEFVDGRLHFVASSS